MTDLGSIPKKSDNTEKSESFFFCLAGDSNLNQIVKDFNTHIFDT